MNREEDASPAAAAFSSVSGVLGGFSMTLVVLALSPQVISSDISKDWIVATILLSAGLYIYASSIFANAMSFEDRAVNNSPDSFLNGFTRYSGLTVPRSRYFFKVSSIPDFDHKILSTVESGFEA